MITLSIKKHRVADWIRIGFFMLLLPVKHSIIKDRLYLSVKRKDLPKTQDEKSRHFIVISEKIDFKNLNRREREGHLMLMKGTNLQEEITSLNIFAPSIAPPHYKVGISYI